MTAVVTEWPAGMGPGQPSGQLRRDGRWDRRVALGEGESAALVALGRVGLRRRVAGIPRRTARHWHALARLTTPLDETLAGLHHGDHVRFRRAGAQAAAIVLQHCADTGQSWWGWTPWEWARLCGGSAREFMTSQPLPTESTVRPFVVALAYLLGGFSDFHRLGMFNRLHLACMIFGEPAVEESLCRASEVLDRWGYRDSLGAKHRMRGVFSQALLLNRSPRLDDLDTEAFAALRAHPATDGHQGSMLYALQRVVAALGYCDPPVRTGNNHAADIEGADLSVDRLDPALAGHLDSDSEGARHDPHHHGQGRAVVGRRAPRDHRAWSVDQGDLRGLGRRGRPDERRRLGSASRRARRPCRRTNLAAHQSAQPHGHAHVLPRLPGMGMDPTPVRPESRAGPPA